MAIKDYVTNNPTPAPEWLRDAIIYELNPRTFTSPKGIGEEGDGSGTFRSMKEALPYLKELGINTIWMAGHTHGSRHFSNVWTVYAMEDPRHPDPALGTPQDLKDLIAEAHRLGIRVLGEVVTHGVTKGSPLVREHPEWFSGGEWGMVDFDYKNQAFRQFWIELWTQISLEYDFDGWRLDGPNGVSSFEDTMGVWDPITQNCLKAGKALMIMGENSKFHLRQHENCHFSHDIAENFQNHSPFSTMQISCHDEGINMGPGNYYALRGSRFKFGYSAVFGCHIPLFMAGEEFDATPAHLPRAKKSIYEGFQDCKEIAFYDATQENLDSGWLLISQINLEQRHQPGHREMWEDCHKILEIRERNRDILHYNRQDTQICSVASIPKSGSVPYIRYLPGQSAILVVGNERPQDQDFLVNIPLSRLGFSDTGIFSVTNLFTDETKEYEASSLVSLPVRVLGDYKPGGGVQAFRIRPV